MHTDLPSKTFNLNFSSSSSKSFALDIFLTIFSSPAKELLHHFLFRYRSHYGTYHPAESSLCWPFGAGAANMPPLPPSLHPVMNHLHYWYAYTARTHPWPVAEVAGALAEFAGAVAEVVVAVLPLLTAVGPWVRKINPINEVHVTITMQQCPSQSLTCTWNLCTSACICF